jgi:hypothetical protein
VLVLVRWGGRGARRGDWRAAKGEGGVRVSETLDPVYILGAIYRAELGFSKLEWAWPF